MLSSVALLEDSTKRPSMWLLSQKREKNLNGKRLVNYSSDFLNQRKPCESSMATLVIFINGKPLEYTCMIIIPIFNKG